MSTIQPVHLGISTICYFKKKKKKKNGSLHLKKTRSCNDALVLLLNIGKLKSLMQTFGSPANIYLFKVNNRSTRKRCEICSKSTIKTSERRHWRHSGVFIVNFEHISPHFLLFLLLTLNKYLLAGSILETKYCNW